ncbi:MAG: hypothetical protein V4726_01495 [Verrucomicrobiota bacterium]
MKIVFNLLVVALAVAAGWFLHPDVVNWMGAKKAAAKKAFEATVQAAVDAKGESSGTSKTSGGPPKKDISSAASQLAETMRKNKPKTADSSSAPPEVPPDDKGMAGSGTETAVTAAGPAVDEIETRYPLPSFKPIDEITREWSSIPSRAFPRTVKTLVAVTFEGPGGKIRLPEKSDALAVGMVQGMLVLMRNKEDPSRSMVPLANTDLKQSLTMLYDKFKAFKTEEVMKQRQRARDLKSRGNGATAAELAAAGPRPKVDDKGVIAAMMQSLQAREIKETTADRVTAWGSLNIEEIEGKTFWTGTLQCTVDNAIFGPIPTELIALIRDEKVVKWLYSGSREEVQ